MMVETVVTVETVETATAIQLTLVVNAIAQCALSGINPYTTKILYPCYG